MSERPRPEIYSVHETYREPLSRAETGLRYFVHKRTGQHVIGLMRPAGEDIGEMGWHFDTLADARAKYREVRADIIRRGYSELVRKSVNGKAVPVDTR
jgi:hypothetical protein